MIHDNRDYKRLKELFADLTSPGFSNTDSDFFKNEIEKISVDSFAKEIELDSLYNFFFENIRLKKYLNNTENKTVPLDLLIAYYTKLFILNKLTADSSYAEIVGIIEKDHIYHAKRGLRNEIKFITCSFYLSISENLYLEKFTIGLDISIFGKAEFFCSIIPFAHNSKNEILNWINIIGKAQRDDGAVGYYGAYWGKWCELNEEKIDTIHEILIPILEYQYSRVFFISMLQEIVRFEKRPVSYYSEELQSVLKPENAYIILDGIGTIAKKDVKEQSNFFKLLDRYLSEKILSLQGYIRLSSKHEHFTRKTRDQVTGALAINDDVQLSISLINYLLKYPIDKQTEWFGKTCKEVLMNADPSVTNLLNLLLQNIGRTNLTLAYEIFTKRIEMRGSNEVLISSLKAMKKQDTSLFYTHFLFWLNSENRNVHVALLYISSKIDDDYKIDTSIIERFSSKELAYIAIKTVGYIYSKEPLQGILISIIKSQTNEQNEGLKELLKYILIEYLIYNYRGTLDILRQELGNNLLTIFAKGLFQESIDYYEDYFTNLNNINLQKELRIESELLKIRRFYEKKNFEEAMSKKSRKGFLSDLFNETHVNAHMWAIQRPNQPKHDPKPLGNVKVETEFPSGEKLSPVFQDRLRRTYQLLKKDEINID